MSAKKWLILLAVAAVVLTGVGVAVCVGFGIHAGGRPVYHTDQTASAHAGYLRTTMTSGKEVYVNDYEEAALRLSNPEPSQVIGFLGTIGITGVRAIPGQPVTAYLAGDEGSEMPAYTPLRHASQPAFNWRTATFREMTYSAPGRGGALIKTTDAALLSEVVRLLRVGSPVTRPGFPMAGAPSVSTLNLNTGDA